MVNITSDIYRPNADRVAGSIVRCGGPLNLSSPPSIAYKFYAAIQIFLSESNNCDARFVIGKNDMAFRYTL